MFPTEDEALKFLEDLDLDEARVKLLLELGRVLEAAAIYAKNGDILTAVETLKTSIAHGVDLVRPATEYLLTGLRRAFTLGIGVTPSSASPTISRLLELAGQLDKVSVTEQEWAEVSFPLCSAGGFRFTSPLVRDVSGDPTC